MPVPLAFLTPHLSARGTFRPAGPTFSPTPRVRLQLVANDQVVDTFDTTVTQDGQIEDRPLQNYAMPLLYGYDGVVIVVADQYDPYRQQVWAVLTGQLTNPLLNRADTARPGTRTSRPVRSARASPTPAESMTATRQRVRLHPGAEHGPGHQRRAVRHHADTGRRLGR